MIKVDFSSKPNIDFDEMVNQFRLASRMLFNFFFHIRTPYQNNGGVFEEGFSEVEKLLFEKLVLERAGLTNLKYGNVQPNIIVEIRNGDRAPVMINRDIKCGYWDHSVTEVAKDAKLLFVSFFDWDQLEYRDNRYVRVLIENWPSRPEVIGKHALIESQYVSFRLAYTNGPVT